MSKDIRLKGWLLFSEPKNFLEAHVVLKKPSASYIKAWGTKAVPVSIRSLKEKKK